jgi:hypothetical protein
MPHIYTKDSNGNDAERVVLSDTGSNEWSYGTWPQDRYDVGNSTSTGAGDNDAHLAVEDQDTYEALIFEATTGEVTLSISIDGTNYLAGDARFVDLGQAASAVTDSYKGFKQVATTNGGTGPYLLVTPCKAFKFLNDGATQSVVTYAQLGKAGV